MKNFITKILLIFAFILAFAGNILAADLNINSVTYDNSGTFFSINSYDNEDYSFAELPKLYVNTDANKAFFDINSAVLRCAAQDLVLNSNEIKEILVKQHSTDPNVVRVIISYNEGFNPKNIQLKRVNNSLYVRLKTTGIQNFYFQPVYADSSSGISELYEPINIQIPVLANQSMVSQINSAFKLGETTEDKNYILTKKDLVLPTKYYLDDISVKNGKIHVNGIGSYTLVKPFMLKNPTRIVYDIPNAIVNSSLRNKEIFINSEDSIKAGQFDKRTVRLVITTQNPEKYIPILYADAQRMVFIDKNNANYHNILLPRSTLNNVTGEKTTSDTYSLKLFFSKPIVYAVQKNSLSFDLYLLNVEKTQDIDLKIAGSFEGAQITQLKNGGLKYSFPLDDSDNIDIHSGLDGKTLRLKVKTTRAQKAIKPVVTPPETTDISELLAPKRKPDGKIYVVIDPGHGGSDCGATRNKIYEKDITLDVSKRVEKLLEKKGYEVFMTRTKDETVSLQERVEISENIQPDIFISIHVNSSNSSTPKGLETHYYKDNSLVLAKTVHASLLNHVNASDRGLFKSKFYVINHTTAPAVLVEIGFISNDTERSQLVTDSRKQATAKAIVEGIHDYFRK